MSAASDALRTIKKALAIVKPMINEDGAPLESGKSEAGILAAVRKQMWTSLKGRTMLDESETITDDEAADDGDDPVTIPDVIEGSDSPAGWFFAGYMAFVLFGPFAPENRRLGVFISDWEMFMKHHSQQKKKESGRNATRARDMDEQKKANAASNKRSAEAGASGRTSSANSSAGGTGDNMSAVALSMTERVALVSLDLCKYEQAKRTKETQKERQWIALKFRISAIEFRMQWAERRNDEEQVTRLECEYDDTYEAIKDLSTDSPQSTTSADDLLAEALIADVAK